MVSSSFRGSSGAYLQRGGQLALGLLRSLSDPLESHVVFGQVHAGLEARDQTEHT